MQRNYIKVPCTTMLTHCLQKVSLWHKNRAQGLQLQKKSPVIQQVNLTEINPTVIFVNEQSFHIPKGITSLQTKLLLLLSANSKRMAKSANLTLSHKYDIVG
jgi:hypothetical protein